MNKFLKCLFPLFLVLISVVVFTACSGSTEIDAYKWLEVDSATGYLYNSTTNRDEKINAKQKGFTDDTFANNKEFDTPYLRYSEIHLKVKESFEILGLAFELKGQGSESFQVDVEVQLYKNISLPSNWSELTDEAKLLWEKENRIKDRQFDSVFVNQKTSAVSFSFATEGKIDKSYEIRIIFTSVEQGNDYLKNFAIDNFIVLVED